MKKQKAQITLFIIIGILIVAIIIGFFVLKNMGSGIKRIDPEIVPVNDLVTNCLKETGLDAIDYTSKRGGFYREPINKLANGIAYYLYDGINYMPTKEEMERQISYYIDDRISACIDLSRLNEYKIVGGEIKTTTKIDENKVRFILDYPLKITKGDKTYNLNNFESENLVRLNVIYDSLIFIMEDQMKNQETMCVTCYSYLNKEYFLELSSLNYDQDSAIITIKDPKSQLNNGTLVFNFANKYVPFEL